MFLTINLGIMIGMSRKAVSVLKRRSVAIARVKETKWKGAKDKQFGDTYDMYYF